MVTKLPVTAARIHNELLGGTIIVVLLGKPGFASFRVIHRSMMFNPNKPVVTCRYPLLNPNVTPTWFCPRSAWQTIASTGSRNNLARRPVDAEVSSSPLEIKTEGVKKCESPIYNGLITIPKYEDIGFLQVTTWIQHTHRLHLSNLHNNRILHLRVSSFVEMFLPCSFGAKRELSWTINFEVFMFNFDRYQEDTKHMLEDQHKKTTAKPGI